MRKLRATWQSGVYIITLCMLSGCIHFMPSSITITLPISRHARVEYGIDLHAALQQEISSLVAPFGSLETTIIAVTPRDTLVGAAGISYAVDMSMTVDAVYTAGGTVKWQQRIIGNTRCYKPFAQQEYEHAFAHARQELCYDVARQIRVNLQAVASKRSK